MIAPMMIGTTELVLLAGIALLLFGGKKLPELMRGMGRGVKNFREGLNEPEAPAEDNAPDDAPAGQTAPAATPARNGEADGGHAPAAAREKGASPRAPQPGSDGGKPAGPAPAEDGPRHD